jgi:hypothetical protein
MTHEDDALARVDLSDGSTLFRTASADCAFPHVCAGTGCAICRWVGWRMHRNNLRPYHDFVYERRGESAL